MLVHELSGIGAMIVDIWSVWSPHLYTSATFVRRGRFSLSVASGCARKFERNRGMKIMVLMYWMFFVFSTPLKTRTVLASCLEEEVGMICIEFRNEVLVRTLFKKANPWIRSIIRRL